MIRISGERAKEIAGGLFYDAKGERRRELEPRRALYGVIKRDGRIVDDVIVTYFAGPNSYTGEDCCEISCHGGLTVTGMVLKAVIDAGAIQAAPGEFTRRAFVNGRMSLSKAEGVSRLLEAKTEEAAYLASSVARGGLEERIAAIREPLLAAASSLFAAIDYPEEDMEELEDEKLDGTLKSARESVEALIKGAKSAMAVVEGVRTVIVGKPNAGKSSLFNRLIGEDRAIVTEIKGTTRDVIEYPVKANKALLRLCDTAGLREEGADEIEKLGMKRVADLIEGDGSALALATFDGSAPPDADDLALIKRLEKIKDRVIPVINKSDLGTDPGIAAAASRLGEPAAVSAVTGEGIGELTDRIERYCLGDGGITDNSLVTEGRQRSMLISARDALAEAQKALADGLKDACGAAVESALAALWELDGRGVSQKIVEEIFSRFCVGK